jgi:hypothetical protein
MPGFRVPPYMISNFEFVFHTHYFIRLFVVSG